MTTKHRSYRRNRTPQEERQRLEEIRDRLQWRLSHQAECFIYCVEREERELAEVIERLCQMDEVRVRGW